MPFDPNLPQAGTDIDAVEMRGQLTGLKDLIDAVPTITSAVVDAVDTLPPGEVSAQDLADGLETRAFAIPSVGTLEQSAEAEYSPTQQQDIINTLNALITALKGG